MNNLRLYINPDGLSKNPAFSQVVMTQGSGKTIYIGGQDALNAQMLLRLFLNYND